MTKSCSTKTKVRSSEEQKVYDTRINKIIGQLNGIKEMIENNRYCDDILIQLSAVDKAIKSLANIILDKHMHTCLIEHIKNDQYEAIDEIVDLFKRFQ